MLALQWALICTPEMWPPLYSGHYKSPKVCVMVQIDPLYEATSLIRTVARLEDRLQPPYVFKSLVMAIYNIVHDQVHSSQPIPWAHTVLASTLCMHQWTRRCSDVLRMRNAPVHLQSSPSPVLVLVTANLGGGGHQSLWNYFKWLFLLKSSPTVAA